MLEIIPYAGKFVIRRVCPAVNEGGVLEFWAGNGWTREISKAKSFDTEDDAEDCRVVG